MYDSVLWSLPASMWSSSGVVRRVKAACGSLSKASALLRAYDIYVHTPQEELLERVLELINDARVAWPIEKFVEGVQRDGGGGGVWRYVFVQEGCLRGISHHAADLIYLFDNVPSITSISQSLSISSDDSSDSFDHHVQSHVHIHYEEEEEWALPIVNSFTFSLPQPKYNPRTLDILLLR